MAWANLGWSGLCTGHGEAFGRQHISKVFAGSDVELALVCMGTKSISMESEEYFLNMGFVIRNIVRIDEDVVQIYDDYISTKMSF